jgi:hypothetical protein
VIFVIERHPYAKAGECVESAIRVLTMDSRRVVLVEGRRSGRV